MLKTILLTILLIMPVVVSAETQKPVSALSNKKVVMIIGNQMFHDLEFKELNTIFKREGVEVVIASSSLSEAVGMGMYKLRVKPDMVIRDIDVKDYDAIVFIGGPGAHEFTSNHVAHRIAKESVKLGKILAAIQLAPEILANAGVLKGKKAVAYLSYNIKAKDAIVTDKMVERDGNLITARSQGAASEFGEAIIAALKER
ncbi:MAG: DJ-1/PfpI family protein [Proteobacteria bacterium]|nr:DJ-1/PfpI family protein [Pseudomonadota bacterium]